MSREPRPWTFGPVLVLRARRRAVPSWFLVDRLDGPTIQRPKELGHEAPAPPPRPARPRRAGRFKPIALTAAAVTAFGLTVGAALAASGFVDVTDNHPASAEITAAHQVGVFQGYGDGTFRPDLKLTRGQAELVIRRMLTWQGTDDDGNFEISRADAAVLAMSGLCGLDPDRIPACAAVGAAEVQAAYDRGFDDGLDAAAPTGSTPTSSTPPPVTVPAEPATAAEKCDAVAVRYTWTKERINGWGRVEGTQNVDGWRPKRTQPTRNEAPTFVAFDQGRGTWDVYTWEQYYEADLEDGWFVCTSYYLRVRHFIFRNHEGEIEDLPLPAGEKLRPHPRSAGYVDQYHKYYIGPEDDLSIIVTSRCWVTRTDPVTGEEYYEQPRQHSDAQYHHELINENWDGSNLELLRYEEHPLISSVIRMAIAGDRPDPDLWEHDPADCPDGEPVSR